MKVTQIMIMDFIKPFIDRYERKIRKTRGKNPTVKYGEFRTTNGGVLWEKDKEFGNLYHAYCYGDLVFNNAHGYNKGLFEDATNYKKDCESYARKHGWIIGRGIYKDIPICPKCAEKIKQRIIYKRSKRKIDAKSN